VVAVSSHVAGERMKEMIERVEAGDVATARKINQDLSPLYKGTLVTTNPIPIKAALEMVGHPVGPPRLPLVPANDGERTKIQQALRDAGLKSGDGGLQFSLRDQSSSGQNNNGNDSGRNAQRLIVSDENAHSGLRFFAGSAADGLFIKPHGSTSSIRLARWWRASALRAMGARPHFS